MMAWVKKKLGDVCVKIQDGAHHSPKATLALRIPDSYPYITSKNIRNGYMQLENVEYVNADFHNSIYPRCTPALGDVLLTKDGANTGNVTQNTLDEPFSLLSSVCLLKPDRAALDSRYLMYYLQSPEGLKQMIGQMTGTAIKRIILKTIKNSCIPLPPLPEQRRIVAILDEAFAGLEVMRANAEKNLQNARDIAARVLNETLGQAEKGCAETTLAEVCQISSKLVDPRLPEFADLPHIGAGNIVERTGEVIDIKTAKEEGLISGKYIFDASMVLYSKIRPYLMKVCRPAFNGLCSADVYPLLPVSGKLTKDFLFYLLLSEKFTLYAISGSDRAGMPKVNRDHLFAYRLRLPSVEQQIQISGTCDQLFEQAHSLQYLYERKLFAIDELKQSVLQIAFSGELASTEAIAA